MAARDQPVLEAPLPSAEPLSPLHPFLLPPQGPCSSASRRTTGLSRQRASCLSACTVSCPAGLCAAGPAIHSLCLHS